MGHEGQGGHRHDAVPASLLAERPALARHVLRPTHLGRIAKPDGLGRATRECGDTIEVTLAVRGGRIVGVATWPQGCAVVVACASMAATLAADRDLVGARRAVTAEAIEEALGGLPPGESHCAELAAAALRAAIDDAITTGREPWRRVYRSAI